MKLSFVVVAFGNPNTLRTCLSSLIDQTEQDFEIILVDNTPSKEKGVQNRNLSAMDPRITYSWTAPHTAIIQPPIRHKRCLYTATEIGVGLAKGEWLAFPSADDYYVPFFAERMLRKASEDDLQFVHCDVVLGSPTHSYFLLKTAPHNCSIDKCSFIMKRDLFEGFKSKHINYELADGLFVEELIIRGIKHGRLDEVLACHN